MCSSDLQDSAYRPSQVNMASARIQITVESACNLYNSDGVLAGKSDPYVIVEVPGQKSMKFQTEVISNELNPVWNFTGEIDGFMDGDVLRFTVMDKDTFPKPDDFLGKVELTAQDFYPHGFHGELTLADSKTQATLTVKVVAGVEGVEGSSSAAALASGIVMQGLQVYNPGVLTTTTTTSHSMTYSAPQVTMNGMVTTSIVGSQSIASQSMASQSITYAAPQAPVPSQSVAATGKVVVHPPVTVTAEEFARINGTLVTEPLPVTVGIETVGVETNREVVVNDTEVVDKTVKIKKKKKSKQCC